MSQPTLPCQRRSLWRVIELFLLVTVALFCAWAIAANAQETNSVTPAKRLPDPSTVQQQFNEWSVVLLLIGGAIWHALLKIWPALKAVAAWWVDIGGWVGIKSKFKFGNKPPTETTKQ